MDDDGFYTVKEVCNLLHVARETLRRWERDRWFPLRYRFSRAKRGRRRVPKVGGSSLD